jgi:hypothetical protein
MIIKAISPATATIAFGHEIEMAGFMAYGPTLVMAAFINVAICGRTDFNCPMNILAFSFP